MHAAFFDECQAYLSQAVQTTHSLMIAGDFNIHMDTDKDADKIRMCDVLSEFKTQDSMSPCQLMHPATHWI